MAQYQEGQWPMTEPRDEVAADVTKFIGRSNFVSPTKRGETVSSITNEQREIFLPTGTHPTIFEYVKQFETQADRSDRAQPTDVIEGTTSNIAQEQDMLSSRVSGLPRNIQYPESASLTVLHRDAVNTSELEPSGQAGFVAQASESIIWPSNSLYGDSSSELTNLQGYAGSGIPQPLVHDDLYPAQGTDPFQLSEQISQDQVWEELLSVLIP
ncbi:16203_t:CDS:1 [Acaulospora colombiana]|uniref:16203_t:CDS:1 n=1 Tax=Acaulospora colombiana TaxID=27376 RepID=A0ACA9PTH8_9GLOM|nr:16203_t:CDS:1 [Acaulospora colombiana]